jgi:WD40 repeat protein
MHAQGHGDVINGIAWSPNGKLMATACDDMHLRLFDLHKLAAKDPSFKHHEMRNTPLGVGFGNDGHSLVIAMRGKEEVEQRCL